LTLSVLVSTHTHFSLELFTKIAANRYKIAANGYITVGFKRVNAVSKNLKINSVERISSEGKHCAFTGLIKNPFDMSNQTLLSIYRRGLNHVSPDGAVIVCKLNLKSGRKIYQRLVIPSWDLRDPKFCFDGRKLIITAFAKHKSVNTDSVITKMVSYFSTTGDSWSSPHFFGKSGWWLWRLTWHKSKAYGFAYNRSRERIDLYEGDPRKQLFLRKNGVMSLDKYGYGYPNESHILFDKKDNATAIVRRDADSFSAKLGFSSPPYTHWIWHDLKYYIGGPVMLVLTDTMYLVAGRNWDNKKATTAIWLLSLADYSLKLLITLPSKGDNSYPGLVWQGDTLYVSYYSDHIDNKTRVYLAEISGMNTLLDKVK